MLDICINLAVKMKLHLNVVSCNGTVAKSREKLLAFYDIMPTHPDSRTSAKRTFTGNGQILK